MIKVAMAGQDEIDLTAGSEPRDEPLDGWDIRFGRSGSCEAKAGKSLFWNTGDISICDNACISHLKQPIRH